MAVELISDFALIADRLPTRDSEAVLRTLDAALEMPDPALLMEPEERSQSSFVRANIRSRRASKQD